MHKPVLLREVLNIFNPQPGQTFVDATVGEGGHAKEIFKKIIPGGVLLGLDWDPVTLKKLKAELDSGDNSQLILLNENYTSLGEIATRRKLRADGILFDLGFGTHTLRESGRGFSFLKDEALDMRYNPETTSVTAADILNKTSENDLEKIFKEYGEEKFSRRIARGIVLARAKEKIKQTGQLVQIIKNSIPTSARRQKIHPATRVFQALRIHVNQELSNLRVSLPRATDALKPGGKIIVISFHSLEDRMVKNFLREEETKGLLKIINKKPLRPTREEVAGNPAARSAKLRAAEKLGIVISQ